METIKEIKESKLFKQLMLASRKIDGCLKQEPKVCGDCESREGRVIKAIKILLND